MFCFLDTRSSSAVPTAFQWSCISRRVTSFRSFEEASYVVQDGSPILQGKFVFIVIIVHCGQNAKLRVFPVFTEAGGSLSMWHISIQVPYFARQLRLSLPPRVWAVGKLTALIWSTRRKEVPVDKIMTTVVNKCETVYTQFYSVRAGTLILQGSRFGLQVCAGNFRNWM